MVWIEISVFGARYMIWGGALYFLYLATLRVSVVSASVEILEYLESSLSTETYKAIHLKYVYPFMSAMPSDSRFI